MGSIKLRSGESSVVEVVVIQKVRSDDPRDFEEAIRMLDLDIRQERKRRCRDSRVRTPKSMARESAGIWNFRFWFLTVTTSMSGRLGGVSVLTTWKVKSMYRRPGEACLLDVSSVMWWDVRPGAA